MKKPCPFCGSNSVSLEQGSTFRWRRIECPDCYAIGPEARTDAQALEEWNTRQPDATFTARIAGLEDLVSEICGYLDPKITGQINTVNTGSILHQKMWKALAGK